MDTPRYVGFTCAYAPLPLFDAAGFVPYRLLPTGEAPEQSGSLLHDNLCPHVKRVLDRALAADLPPLAGVVVMESCDTMRRLADGWRKARPEDRLTSVDLPTATDARSVAYFATQLEALARVLESWGGRPVTDEALWASIARYSELQTKLAELRGAVSWAQLQEGYNLAVTQPLGATLDWLAAIADTAPDPPTGVPLLLVGNVLPDPAAFELLAQSGVGLVGNELCTGERQLTAVDPTPGERPLAALAAASLDRPGCARTLVAGPGQSFASQTVEQAKAAGARGVIAYVMKFCDPYLARLPTVREALKEAGLPLLILEGDCTLRSLGQHRTRIEAFVEMLS